MNIPDVICINAFAQHLRQLTIIRSLLLMVLWGCLMACAWLTMLPLPYYSMVVVLGVLSVVHGLTFLRLKNPLVVTNVEFFIQLLLDVICLNALFYLSGGATNPFVSYLLVSICISAATLPWRFTWLISALCIIAYSFLLFFHL